VFFLFLTFGSKLLLLAKMSRRSVAESEKEGL